MHFSAQAAPRHKNNWQALLIPLLFLVTILVYWPGLEGPFLFDDHVHIVKNAQVHITSLDADSLRQAWHSSLVSFPASRPLAQMTFGINHAISGLSPFAYKATNLALHLLNGCLVFLLINRLSQLRSHHSPRSHWLPLLVTAFWLLHPLNFTPVIYVIQRMVLLSTLFVLLGLLLYLAGRSRLSENRRGGLAMMLLSLPLALVGFLAKESAALFPLLVLSLELTLLQDRPVPNRRLFRTALFLVVALPLLAGAWYLISHPGLLSYNGRNFSLAERLMTEARVLWFYLQQLVLPIPTRFGLYHDDFEISRSLLSPWTTLPAIAGILLLLALSLRLRKSLPVVSFAVLFFLAAHALESSIIPLEPVFEHRNYLASLGPLVALGWLLTRANLIKTPLALVTVSLLLLTICAATFLRAYDWRSLPGFYISEVSNHPASPRANFGAAKYLIGTLDVAVKPEASYRAARHYLETTRRLTPDHLDSLFALIILNLHVGKDPEPEWVESLVRGLRDGVVDATKLTTSQFSFLVRWHMNAGTHKLPQDTMVRLFEAALDNPRHNKFGRSGILSALRAYYDLVLEQPERALPYAREAVKVWSDRWHYQQRLIELLIRLGQLEEARAALQEASARDPESLHLEARKLLASEIDRLDMKRTP